MIFKRGKKKVKEGMTTMDKVVTGVIIGGAAASIFGVSRTKKGRNFFLRIGSSAKKISKKGFSLFGKATIALLDLYKKK